jgi:hypothetical protein
MEDVIDLLRERNQPVPVPLELPDEDLLIQIEEELFIALPDDLREFLLTVSDVVYGSLEPATVTDARSHTYLPEMAAQAWDAGLPRHYLPVCESADGYYCLGEEGIVYDWQPEGAEGIVTDDTMEGVMAEEWNSIWHWARDVWLKS